MIQTSLLHFQPRGWVQRDMSVNAPGDRYEREADQVADDHALVEPRPVGMAGHGGTLADGYLAHFGRRRVAIIGVSRYRDQFSGCSTGGKVFLILSAAFLKRIWGTISAGCAFIMTAVPFRPAAISMLMPSLLGSTLPSMRANISPATDAGRHLLAHELTHVVQQGALRRTFPAFNAARCLAICSA